MFTPIKNNEGDLDRAIRIIVSTFLILYALFTQVWWLLLIGLPLFVTGATGFCGVYALLGISTCPVPVKPAAKVSAKSVVKPVIKQAAKQKKVAKQKVAKKSKVKPSIKSASSKTSKSKSKKK